jgi:hypothetical protein
MRNGEREQRVTYYYATEVRSKFLIMLLILQRTYPDGSILRQILQKMNGIAGWKCEAIWMVVNLTIVCQ